MHKKIVGVVLIGAVMILGACHKAPPEQILETIGNKPVPDWVSSPREYRIKKEAEGYKLFFVQKTFPGNYQATNFKNTPFAIVCSGAENDLNAYLNASLGPRVYQGHSDQKFFILKAKEADGSIIQRAYCGVSWKPIKLKSLEGVGE